MEGDSRHGILGLICRRRRIHGRDLLGLRKRIDLLDRDGLAFLRG